MKEALSKTKKLAGSLKWGAKLVLIFNYHRLAPVDVDRDQRDHPSYTVSEATFKQQIKFLSQIGKFVSLDEIREAKNLSRLNFALVFDDMSDTMLSIKSYLETQAIPYAVSLVTDVEEHGEWVSDKGTNYNLVAENIVNIEIPTKNRHSCLGWDKIKQHFIDNKLVTIVNRGRQHLNMVDLSPGEVYSEVTRSVADFEKFSNLKPVYYAVQDGTVEQSLALDLTGALLTYNYKGVLWLNGGSNLIKNPYRAQMIHLSQIRVPDSFYQFIKLVFRSLGEGHRAIIEHIPPTTRRGRFKIIASDDARRAVVFENLMRQGKDYSSDPVYYKYAHQDNPYKDGHPDYYAVESAGRIEATVYHLHLNYTLDSKPIKGCISCSWRKLPVSNDLASGMLLLKSLEKEPVVCASNPLEVAAKALKAWKKIPVNEYRIKIKKQSKASSLPAEYKVRRYDTYSETINPLTTQVNQQFRFSVQRSPDFYRWRYDQYPLAKSKYFVHFTGDQAVAYYVTLYKPGVLAISDFYSSSMKHFALLFDDVKNYCQTADIHTIEIATSLPDVSKFLENKFRIKPKTIYHYYHFNRDFPEIKCKWAALDADWENIVFHETRACGDVLLK